MTSPFTLQINGGSSDNCTAPEDLDLSPAVSNFTCANVGDNNITLIVTDQSGNTAVCVATVTVQDVTPPFIAACPADTTVDDCDDVVPDMIGGLNATDNCGVASATQNPVAGTDFGQVSGNSVVVTFTVTDVNGNVSTCSANVIIEDDVPPVFENCPPNVTVNNDVDLCGAVVWWTPPVAEDNCDDLSVTQTGPAPGSFFPVAGSPHLITYMATDQNGVTASCTFEITVQDKQKPKAVCKDATVYLDQFGQVNITASDVNGGSTDNCQIATRVINRDHFDCGDVGDNFVTLTVTDASGNTASCVATVTVTDNMPPTFSCPSSMTVPECDQLVPDVVSLIGNEADNCGVASVVQDPAAGLDFANSNGDVLEITVTVTDVNGNTASCIIPVTVVDSGDPSFVNCPGNILINNDVDLCGANVWWAEPIAIDGCTGSDMLVNQTGGTAPGSYFSLMDSPHEIVYTAMDENGNTTSCAFTITVRDVQLPDLSCPSGIQTVFTNNNNCSYTNYGAALNATATDNCMVMSLINDFTGTNSLSNAVFPIGATVVHWTAADMAGNSVECVFFVKVIDDDPPTVDECPENIVENTDPGECSAVVWFDAPTFNDNCGGWGVPGERTEGLAPGSAFPVGVTNVVYQYVDAANNIPAVCNFTVTVEDHEDPKIYCPQNIVVGTNGQITSGTASVWATGACGIELAYNIPTATDNCSANVFLQGGLGAGPNFYAYGGLYTETYNALDPSGNEVSCSFTILVKDNVSPTITCPSNTTVSADPGECDAAVDYAFPYVGDNCPGFTITQLDGPNSGEEFELGTTNVAFKVTDEYGNTTVCSFTVTVTDNESPKITTCPADRFVNTSSNGTGDCSGKVPNLVADAVATDNCAGNLTITQSPLANTNFGAAHGDELEVIITVTDLAGNSTTCEVELSLRDDEKPSINCAQVETAFNADAGLCSYQVNGTALDPAFGDNCSVQLSNNYNGLPSLHNALLPLGNTTVIWTATDENGNTNTCAVVYSVEDTEAPFAMCMDQMDVALNGDGVFQITVAMVDIGSWDNCGPLVRKEIKRIYTNNWASSIYADCDDLNNNPLRVVLEVEDQYGNVSQCTTYVEVNDVTPPVIACPSGIQTVFTNLDNCSYTHYGPALDATATDNCEIVSLVHNYAGAPGEETLDGAVFPLGSTVVRWKVRDQGGNTVVCTFLVNVVDDDEPTVQACPQNIVKSNDVNQCSAVVDYSVLFGDNCGGNDLPGTLIEGLPSGSAFPVGTTQVVFHYNDPSGNGPAVCAFTVTVNDTQLPQIVCPANISVNTQGVVTAGSATVTPALCGVSLAYTAPVGTDNCPNPETDNLGGLGVGPNFYNYGGTYTETWRVTDASGNSATCSFTITVDDVINPTLTCPVDITVGNDQGVCEATVTYANPLGFDNCANYTITLNNGSLPSGALFPQGTSTVSFTATDDAGNTVLCSFNVTVEDQEAPVITTCAPDQQFFTTNNGIGDCSANVPNLMTQVIATDNCPAGFTISQSPAPGTKFTGKHGDELEVIITVTDFAGNATTCEAELTLIDNENPAITCPANPVQLNNTADLCGFSVFNNNLNATATDNCGPIAITNSLTGNQTLGGTVLPVGSTTVNWLATDAAGNTSACSVTYIVTDNQNPDAYCIGQIDAVLDADGQFQVTQAMVDLGSTDNCGIASIGISRTNANFSQSLLVNCADVLIDPVNIILQVIDVNGNVSQCTTAVKVLDLDPPVLTCPNPVTVSTDAGLCSAVVNGLACNISSTIARRR
ncbi:MAG: HYR domain-containing protein [Lewinellaceae bacterium]|nr:HYR domain-containing protein [Lewinellaceae bacterium]